MVAKDLGGRLVDPSTSDSDERRLLNVVMEMAIAAGIPVPQVYVLDEEPGLNAFVAGTEPGNTAIAVTQGCLACLSRAELQGVVAHEFSHILNGDMKLNLRLIGWVYGLVAVSMLGKGILKNLKNAHGSGQGGGSLVGLIIAVLLIVIGGIGVFFARLLQAAVSRQREYLADASAVQFTREPTGLADALGKMGKKASWIRSPKAAEASHCFFADSESFDYGLETHPPVKERIERLVGKGKRKAPRKAFAQNIQNRHSNAHLWESGLGYDLDHLSVSDRVDIVKGEFLHRGIQADWLLASQVTDKSQALVFGLLLAEDDKLLQDEVNHLMSESDPATAQLAVKWQKDLRALHSAEKITLIDLVIPTLRRLSSKEYERFIQNTRQLIASDGQIDLFEFMLQHQLECHLTVHFYPQPPKKVIYQKIDELREEVEQMASAFAQMDNHPENAFQSGMQELGEWGQLQEAVSIGVIDEAMKKLALSSPLLKKEILLTFARIVAYDNKLTSHEAELLRAAADGIGCAIPPFVADLRQGDN